MSERFDMDEFVQEWADNEGADVRVRGLTGAEWSRLTWLSLGVGIIVGFACGIAVCVLAR